MIPTVRRTILACSLLLLAGCNPPPAAYHEQMLVFGTLVEVKLWGVEEAKAKPLVARLAADFDYMHHTWHAWEPGGLSRVNQLLASGEEFTVEPAILPLIRRGAELSQRSGDLFNPAIGQLIALWGFASDDPPHGPPPDPATIRALVAQQPRMADIILNGIKARGTNPAVKLDFGAFAKGYALDRAIETLREAGVDNAIVNAGGNLRAIGRHGERPWRVGIRNPRGSGVLASVEVAGDESVVTSGDYERFFEWEGVRYNHIIDPRSGYPTQGVTSVTVFCRDGDLADATSTALTVAGPEEWLAIARAMGVTGVMRVMSDGTVYLTPEIAPRIHFETDPAPRIVITEPLSVTANDPRQP